MKTIRVKQFGGPEVMNLEEIAELQPAQDQVVVRLFAAGVNPVDVQCQSGQHSWQTLPYTPGFDGAGIIKSIGAGVTNHQVGERVYTAFNLSGTYAEEVLCLSSQVYPLPEESSFEEGAALFIPYGTAYRALFQRCAIQKGETVLVHGASGAVGIAATQFAVAAGCTVIGSAGTDQGRKLVLEQGAKHVVNHYDAQHYQEIMHLTGGKGVDAVIEMVSANIKQDVFLLAKYGRIAVIGDRTPFEVDANMLTDRDGSIMGTGIGNLPPHTAAEMHAALFQGLKDQSLRPILYRRISLSEAGLAHEIIFKPETNGKIVLIP